MTVGIQKPPTRGTSLFYLRENTSIGVVKCSYFDETTLYQQLIGYLIHLSNTARTYICYAAGLLSRFMKKPPTEIWKAAKRVF